MVLRNDAEEICQFLTFDDDEEDSLDELEEANTLITPIMNYVRDCKGIHSEKISSSWQNGRDSLFVGNFQICWVFLEKFIGNYIGISRGSTKKFRKTLGSLNLDII